MDAVIVIYLLLMQGIREKVHVALWHFIFCLYVHIISSESTEKKIMVFMRMVIHSVAQQYKPLD
jgi:hypothetical protein